MRHPVKSKFKDADQGFAIFCCAQMPLKIPKQREGDLILQIQKNKLVFIQGQVRLRHFLGRALRPRVRLSYDTFWAERCSQDRLGGRALWPHVLNLRPHQLQVSRQASHRHYFSGSTKFNPPLSVLEFYGAFAHNRKWQMPAD